MEKIQKKDFIEIEFTGTVGGNVFDTTNPEEAEQMGVDPKGIKPMIVSVGSEMILKGLDEDLEGKEIGKFYKIHLIPDKAFGPRDPKLVRTVSMKSFKDKNIDPHPGMVIQQMDNSLARIISVSGGRVMIDSNNPLAGKEVDYKYKVTKKITDDREKVNALQDFFFKQRFEFEIVEEDTDNLEKDKQGKASESSDKSKTLKVTKNKTKKAVFKDSKLKPLFDAMNAKFKEILGFEFTVEEKKESKEKEKKNIVKPTQDKTSQASEDKPRSTSITDNKDN